MFLFLSAGIFFMMFSLLFFFAPGLIIKLSEFGNRMIFTDHPSFAHRKLSGGVLLVMSIVMFYLGVMVS